MTATHVDDFADQLPDKRYHQLLELPPSGKLVFKILEYHGELTQKQICEHSRLSPRTVRYALSQLDSLGVIDEDVHFPDARQSLYSLTVAGVTDRPDPADE